MKEVLSLRQAILATVNYFDLLDFSPDLNELSEFLYGWSAPKEVIEGALSGIPEISHAHGYYYLQGREQIAENRKERMHIRKNLWKRINKFRFLLAICPFVRMVAVCNSVALGNADEKSDIDLFVITKAKKLQTARFFLKLLMQIFGVRVHREFIAKRFCLSFFVSEKAMNLNKIAHEFDPHLAYFVKSMIPLFGQNTYIKFLKANDDWTMQYFKRLLEDEARTQRIRENVFAKILKGILEGILLIFGGLPEMLFSKIQSGRDLAHKKRIKDTSGVITNKVVFKFHEADPRQNIAEKFRPRLELI